VQPGPRKRIQIPKNRAKISKNTCVKERAVLATIEEPAAYPLLKVEVQKR
jgi:hypothetical protein